MVDFRDIKDAYNEIIGTSYHICERKYDIRGSRQIYIKKLLSMVRL